MVRVVSALALAAVLLLFPLRTGWGCYDVSEERDRIILFDAENLLPPGQRKYIYTGDQFNQRWHQSNKIGGALNRKEWGRALGMDLDSVDFRQVLYKRSLDTALFAGDVSKLKTSPMALALFARKDLLTYLRMVRSTEEVNQFWSDPWGLTFDTEGEAIRQKMDSCLQVCLLRLQATPDAFLRARYAYQSMRLSYYLSEYQPVLELYEKYLPNEEVSAYLHREAIYYAMRSAYWLGQVARGNYLAAICFEQDTDPLPFGADRGDQTDSHRFAPIRPAPIGIHDQAFNVAMSITKR